MTHRISQSIRARAEGKSATDFRATRTPSVSLSLSEPLRKMSGCLFPLKCGAGWMLLVSVIHLIHAQGKDSGFCQFGNDFELGHFFFFLAFAPSLLRVATVAWDSENFISISSIKIKIIKNPYKSN